MRTTKTCWESWPRTRNNPTTKQDFTAKVGESAHPESRLRLKCDGKRAETRFRLSAKRTSPFKSAVASVQSTTGSRGVRIGGSNAGYTMFRGSVKSTGYPIHSPVSPSLSLPCAIAFQLDSTTMTTGVSLEDSRHLGCCSNQRTTPSTTHAVRLHLLDRLARHSTQYNK